MKQKKLVFILASFMLVTVFVLAFSLTSNKTATASTDTEMVIEKGAKIMKCGSADSNADAKCGEGKCGSGEVKSDSTAKCGEGKCGSGKVESDSTAKCGEGKCGK